MMSQLGEEIARAIRCLKPSGCGCGSHSERCVTDIDFHKSGCGSAVIEATVFYSDGSRKVREIDFGCIINTYTERFIIEDNVLLAERNDGVKLQVLDLGLLPDTQDVISLLKGLNKSGMLQMKDVSLEVDCTTAGEKNCCSKPYRRGNSVYWINKDGKEEWLFDVTDECPAPDPTPDPPKPEPEPEPEPPTPEPPVVRKFTVSVYHGAEKVSEVEVNEGSTYELDIPTREGFTATTVSINDGAAQPVTGFNRSLVINENTKVVITYTENDNGKLIPIDGDGYTVANDEVNIRNACTKRAGSDVNFEHNYTVVVPFDPSRELPVEITEPLPNGVSAVLSEDKQRLTITINCVALGNTWGKIFDVRDKFGRTIAVNIGERSHEPGLPPQPPVDVDECWEVEVRHKYDSYGMVVDMEVEKMMKYH